MIVTLTARKLKPGAFDDFKATFDGRAEEMPDEVLRRWTRVYVTRDVADENVVLSFGLFDGTLDELREIQSSSGRDDLLDQVSPHIDEVLLDGSYEVVEEITP
jgi:hypothetical protein